MIVGGRGVLGARFEIPTRVDTMARWSVRLAAALLVWLSPVAAGGAGWRGGIGVLGDSYSDEYQFYPPDRTTARNWVELLAATRRLDFGPHSVDSRAEPRNQGFAFNWARSDATTSDMIRAGQHTGVAAQVARGEVGLVAIFIGGNDFICALKSPDPPASLRAVTPQAEANVRIAVETILAASPDVKLLVATVPDVRDLPEFAEPLHTGKLARSWADATTSAIRRYNATLRALAIGRPRIAIADLDLQARLANLISTEYIPVAGRRIDRSRTGNDSLHAFLDDRRHAGTIGQGLLARIVVDTVNARFGAGIEPLTDHEILQFATALTSSAPDLATSTPSRVQADTIKPAVER
jgi:hypothetical protein